MASRTNPNPNDWETSEEPPLPPSPRKRKSPGPPTPSTRVLKDFENQREKFLHGSPLSSPPLSRTGSPSSKDKDPEPAEPTKEHEKTPPPNHDPSPTLGGESSPSKQIYKEMCHEETSPILSPIGTEISPTPPSKRVAKAA